MSLARVLLLVAASISFAYPEPTLASPESLTIGSAAPPLDIEHWYSGDVPPGLFAFEPGQVYVVEFWATWCGPCVRSLPHLAELQREYADRGVTILSVSDEESEIVKAFLKLSVRGKDKDDPSTYAELTSGF